jgi:serine/threonine protein phosphatase 1
MGGEEAHHAPRSARTSSIFIRWNSFCAALAWDARIQALVPGRSWLARRMTTLLHRLLRGALAWKQREVPETARSAAPCLAKLCLAKLCPAKPFLAVGDIHGRSDLLAELQRRIGTEHSDWPVVFLGDYIDRGPDSRQVLDLLMAATAGPASNAICLMGNHERMLLDFLEDPSRHGPRWLRNGGVQTLSSFDVMPPDGFLDETAALEILRDQFVTAMGMERIKWMRALPLIWRSGNVWAVHAGASPGCPMNKQSADVLLWGHPHFLRQLRGDGQWIVHGHTIMDAPQARQGRIAVDTGAYATGILTAAAISHEGVAFLQTGNG